MTAEEVPFKGKFGEEVNGPGRTYFDDVVVDNLMEAFLELSAHVWINRDRLYVLEKVLEDRGIEAQKLIEEYVPHPEDSETRRIERQEFVDQVFRSFLRRPRQSDGRGPSSLPEREGAKDE